MVINNNTLYVTDILLQKILACPIDPTTGVLGTCAYIQMTEEGETPIGLAINGDYLYITAFKPSVIIITDFNPSEVASGVYKCPLATLATSGTTSPCELTGASHLNGPYDLAFPDDGFVYITNLDSINDGMAVTRCTTGDLGPCEVSLNFQPSRAAGIVFPPQA